MTTAKLLPTVADPEAVVSDTAPPSLPTPLPGPLLAGLLTTEEVAKVVGVDTSTVRRWRTSNPVQGPPFIKISDRVTKYSAADVDEWLLSLRIDPRMAA